MVEDGYSITWSARSSTDCGIVTTCALVRSEKALFPPAAGPRVSDYCWGA